MTERPYRPRTNPVLLFAAAILGALVMAIVAAAFRGSFGALRDAALAAHLDRTSAGLFPFAMDGLLVVAIIAAVVLRHSEGARRYCLAIIGTYTGASWILNYLHGLGWYGPGAAEGALAGLPWPVVGLVATAQIGTIFLGSHLLVRVAQYLWPAALTDEGEPDTDQADTEADEDEPLVPAPPASNIEAAKAAYRLSREPGREHLSQAKLMDRFGLTKREAARVQSEVKAEPAEPIAVEPPAGAQLNGHAADGEQAVTS